jgi:hypothetical protein
MDDSIEDGVLAATAPDSTKAEPAGVTHLKSSQAMTRAGEHGVPQSGAGDPDPISGLVALAETLRTADPEFLLGLFGQLAKAGSPGGQVDRPGLNFMLSVVKRAAPRDQIEAMLAAQMAAVHVATMKAGRRLAEVKTLAQQDSAERTFNKLARTFTAQVEALKRYRTSGEQIVTVQHVSVSDGGQAIVGNVHAGAAGALRSGRQQRRTHLVNRSRHILSKRVSSQHRRNTGPMRSSPRCGAQTRSGAPCLLPAIRGKQRCRMHGGARGLGTLRRRAQRR